jgi:hypothetical protein
MSEDINKKNENPSDDDFLSSIDGVLDTLLAGFSVPEEPIQALPPPIILIGAKLRPGLSILSTVSNVITRQSEAGLPVGNIFADGPNSNEAMIKIIVQEVINTLLNECVVNVVIDPGVAVTTVGVGNNGAPVISQGYTTTLGIGNGIIR